MVKNTRIGAVLQVLTNSNENSPLPFKASKRLADTEDIMDAICLKI